MMMTKQVTKLTGAIGLAAMITACGGGSSSSVGGTTVSESGNSFVVFPAYDGAGALALRSAAPRAAMGGIHLWKTDGTAAGTVKITDSAGNGFGVASYYMAEMNGKIYYPGVDDAGDVELWVTDGTANGTKRVKDIDPAGSSGPRDMVASEGKLYVNVQTGAAGRELLVTDGSEAGTELLNLRPGGSSTDPESLTPVDGGLFFYDQGNGEVYFTDGTLAGTAVVATENEAIPSGSLAKYPELILDDDWLGYQGKLLFTGRYNSADSETRLYELDQSGAIQELALADGTRLDITENVVTSNGKVYFVAMRSGQGGRTDIFEYDGSAVTILTAKDAGAAFNERLTGTSIGVFMPQSVTPSLSWLYFIDTTGSEAQIRWAVRPVTGSAVTFSGIADTIVDVNGTVFFNAFTTENGVFLNQELWKTDGTQAGTTFVKDVNTDNPAGNSDILPLTSMYSIPPTVKAALGSKYLFLADDGANGFEPWVSNGTETGTLMLKDINAGAGSSLID